MKRLLAIIASLAILAALPATASAGRVTNFTEHTVGIFCDGLTATSGGGFAFFQASVSDEFGAGAFIDYWTTSEPIGPPALTSDFELAADVTWDGTVLAGSIPLRDNSTGEPAGSATFSATLTPSGDPFSFEDSFRNGNQQVRFSGVSQPMDPSGTLTVGSSTFSLDTCFADESTITLFQTNPNAGVFHGTNRDVGCELSNADGDTGFLFASLNEGEAFFDVTAFPADGSSAIGAFGEGTVIDGVLDATFDLFELETGEPVAGAGSLHLEIVGTGEPFDYLLKNATAQFGARGVTLDLEGTLTMGDISFDLGACVGFDGRTKEIVTFPQGPKPGGKVPANDLPSGAKLLTVGSRTSVQTKGASPDREAPYECLTFEDGGDVFEVPVGYTVWYQIVGTGDPITIDTAGSDYDTVIAVYTADGSGGFTPVPDACVDDIFLDPFGRSLQAAVTFDSVAGTTYYVQIGGYPEAFPYGNLRVAVR
jgi:hypothetical protein